MIKIKKLLDHEIGKQNYKSDGIFDISLEDLTFFMSFAIKNYEF